jgi:alkanesulfonate monooxygenase SsuD/methylene tetrahydromethanopterin reductase-like flavin-dependent oxidoreductase (luciferase family)
MMELCQHIFKTLFDPLELLAFVAADTEKISLGTAVIDILEEIQER